MEATPASPIHARSAPSPLLWVLLTFLGSQGIVLALWVITFARLSPFYWTNAPPFALAQNLIGAVWIVLGLLLVIPLARRKRWAWSAVMGILYTRVAAAAANIVRTLLFLATGSGGWGRRGMMGATLPLLPYAILGLALSGIAVLVLFRAAGWFGVERRREWRTTFREGWWAWLIGGLLNVGLPLVVRALFGRGW